MEDLIGCLIGIPAILVGAVWAWNYGFAGDRDKKPYLLVTRQFVAVLRMRTSEFELMQARINNGQDFPEKAEELFVANNGLYYSYMPDDVAYFSELKGRAWGILAELKNKPLINNF